MKCLSIYCDRTILAKGLCAKHYARNSSGLDINQKSIYEISVKERFLNKVEKEGHNGCWIWTAGTRGNNKFKYGAFGYNKTTYSAHRFSWYLFNNKLNELEICEKRDLCICHTCDTPLCVNPNHLYLGTHDNNMLDKKLKNRSPGKLNTHCIKGHEYNDKNTRFTKKGFRQCRECSKLRERIRRKINNEVTYFIHNA